MSLAFVRLTSKVHLVDEAAIRIHIIVIFFQLEEEHDTSKGKRARIILPRSTSTASYGKNVQNKVEFIATTEMLRENDEFYFSFDILYGTKAMGKNSTITDLNGLLLRKCVPSRKT